MQFSILFDIKISLFRKSVVRGRIRTKSFHDTLFKYNQILILIFPAEILIWIRILVFYI